MGIPMMLYSCSSAEKRLHMNKTIWFIKLLVLCFVVKWTVETYDLVQLQASQDSSDLFNPYTLLQIDDDGSFNTKAIKNAYKKLAKRYHPDVIHTEVISQEKA